MSGRIVIAEYIGTFAQAQKVANIQRCPKVSLTIDRDYADWSQIKGLSMGGTAEILTDPELDFVHFHRV